MAHLHDLPEEILFHITSYLYGPDVISLSHTCQRFLYVLQNDHLWNGISDKEHVIKEPDIIYYSKMVHSDVIKLKHYNPKEKINYIQHKRIAKNWHACRKAYLLCKNQLFIYILQDFCICF